MSDEQGPAESVRLVPAERGEERDAGGDRAREREIEQDCAGIHGGFLERCAALCLTRVEDATFVPDMHPRRTMGSQRALPAKKRGTFRAERDILKHASPPQARQIVDWQGHGVRPASKAQSSHGAKSFL